MDAHSRAEELAQQLPQQWRQPFIHFVETGEAEKPFRDFLEADRAAQAAVEIMFNETAAAFEKLAAFLHFYEKAAQQPGDRMPDGTIFAGISPDTGKPMYTTTSDAPLTYYFNEAKKYAAELTAHGHADWRVPTQTELSVLWQNRKKGALKDTFNVSGSFPAGWYVSSTEISNYFVFAQRFSRDGKQGWFLTYDGASLRCVR